MKHIRLPGYDALDLDRLSYSNGDIVNDLTNATVRYMDGVTPGGFKLATQDYVQTNAITSANLATNLATALVPYAKTVDLAPYALTTDVNSAISAIPIYALPTASTSILGGVKVDGTSITINNGIISGANTYVLPTAVAGTSITGTKGGVIPDGTTITISNGVISGANTYVLPTASTSVKGGVKVDGTSITIDGSGVIHGANTYTLPATTTTTLGGVIVPAVATSGITNSSGTIGIATATTTQLGGVIVPATANSGLTNTSGTIRLATATTNQLGGVKVDGVTITINGSGVIAANITGAIVFQGGWSAATNTPTLNNTSSAYNTNGFEFVCTAAGTVNFGLGNTTFAVGDNVIYDGVKWVKIPIGSSAGTTNSIITFDNGGTGAVSGTAFNGSAPFTISYNTLGASPLAGSASLTTVGTVAAGTWNADIISSTYGGTGVNNAGRTLTISGANRTLDQDVTSGSSPSFIGTNFSGTASSLTAGNATSASSATRATNLSSGTANQIPYQTAANTTSFITAASGTNTFLQWTGSAFTWTTVASATTATNLAGGAANRIHVQTAADTSGFIVAPTVTGTYLQWSGSAFVFASVTGATGGTVTSVGGTGTVNGLTLTGTVTSSGNLTLGGTLSLVSPPAIGSTTPNTGQFSILTVNSASTSSVTLSPTGSGTVSISPTTAGTINNMSIGATTKATGGFTSVTATGQASTTTGSGTLYISNTTNSRIDYAAGASNFGAPTFNGISAGAKIIMWPGNGAAAADYALGIEGSTLWYGVPTTSEQFKWYGGTTNVMTLTGLGVLTAASFSGALNGTVGATTASTGAFTTLSASTSVSFSPSGAITLNPTTAGTINNMSIGATTAAAGSFTTLAASSTVSGTGFSTYLASPPAIGGTAAAAITGTVIKATGATAAIGYATGASAGGTVTQLLSRTQGVTLNKITGQITLFLAAGNTGAYTAFTVSNSTVAATDTVDFQCSSSTNTYITFVTAITAGSFTVNFLSINGTASDSPVFNFNVIKGSAN